MRAVIVFCEGNHDIAFVARSLGALAQAQWMSNPIRELPSPFGPVPDPANPKSPKVQSLIAQRYSARSLDDVHLKAAAHPPPPIFDALLRVPASDTLFALVRCHGDGASAAAMGLLADFTALLLPGIKVDVTHVAAAFLFDADDVGVASRQTTFAAAHSAILNGAGVPKHGHWVQGKDFPVGLYLFHDQTTQQGTLEDVLAPLVEAEWGDRWRAADTYLTTYATANDPVAVKPTEKQKAQICITGQFRFCGDPMTQVIGRDGLPANHFTGTASQSIVNFLTGVPWP